MSILENFLSNTPEGTGATLAALACAECLTDRVANEIYEKAPTPGLTAEEFLHPFKYSGLTEPRNGGEWSLDPELRNELVHSNLLSPDIKTSVHDHLLELGSNTDLSDEAGKTIPTYLFSDAGRAYHLAGSGNIDTALELYNRIASGIGAEKNLLTGTQWLAGKLRNEQEQTGVIPPHHNSDHHSSDHHCSRDKNPTLR